MKDFKEKSVSLKTRPINDGIRRIDVDLKHI